MGVDIFYFENDSVGFYGGGVHRDDKFYYRDLIYKTKDGGQSWDKVLDRYEGNSWSLYDLDMRDSLYGLAVGNPGKIYETFDGGESWERRYVEEKNKHVVLAVEFAGQHAIVGSWGQGMYRWEEPDTTDVSSIIIKDDLRVEYKNKHLFIFSAYKNMNISVFNIQGQQVKGEYLYSNGYVDVSQLVQGTYYYLIQSNNKIIARNKFIVMN